METVKKPTNAQLQRRIDNAVIHIDKTKDTKSVFFDDKLLRLTYNDEYAVVGTMFHRHVFDAVSNSGLSRPYVYVRRLVEIALENDCTTKDSNGNMTRSYAKLSKVLHEKEDRREYNVFRYVDWFLFNIYHPLYLIGEDSIMTFMTYFEYLHSIAVNKIFLDGHKDGMTNKQFIGEYMKILGEFVENDAEQAIFAAVSDDERIQQETEALTEQEVERNMEGM